ncbi:aminopeptidase O-like [Uloborus diversus]|uniref:aminopeptidase O-like n=1 Tax=Uloborus diversus TaxID=327109 RepID=UPI002409A669|nr:aminopeptidase O-like [Uloborus diversus]
MSSDDKNNDLPLVSNVNDIVVQHYIFHFVCHFDEKSFKCHQILFLKPVLGGNIGSVEEDSYRCICDHSKFSKNELNKSIASNAVSDYGFVLVLDSHKILVEKVEEIDIACTDYNALKYIAANPLLFSGHKLNFSSDEWSLKVWKDENTCNMCFPKILKITYSTLPDGPSLLWVTDQEQNPAVFTYGAWINNRSLFPCQEPPTAMATWEATVCVDNSSVVLMSGDDEPTINCIEGNTSYYYYTKSVLPLSTLCLAIGFWEEHLICSSYCSTKTKCRIFAPPSLLDKAVQELFEYIPCCLKHSEDFLGPYPFRRIDFLIVPPTFGSLGMASPNIIFLSQSLLAGDGSMCSRVAHEIVHGWFGLLIGASDWTEEWLSEGFATFLEDFLHALTLNMKKDSAKDYREIKALIRKKVLLDEIDNTPEDLQKLRPCQGETTTQSIDGIDTPVVKNGQNPEKAFVQVHYIKGYFLLQILSDMVGFDSFMEFLRLYVDKYKGCLVTSDDFLNLFLETFHNVDIKTIHHISENWLKNPGVVKEFRKKKPPPENKLFSQVQIEIKKWRDLNRVILQKSESQIGFSEAFVTLTPEQIILLLEGILDHKRISVKLLERLNDFFHFNSLNAEVQHRWFELVVNSKYEVAYAQLEQFLRNHLAMGIYLYGELIHSKNKKQKKIAEQCFRSLEHEMEPNYIFTITQMLKNSGKV